MGPAPTSRDLNGPVFDDTPERFARPWPRLGGSVLDRQGSVEQTLEDEEINPDPPLNQASASAQAQD